MTDEEYLLYSVSTVETYPYKELKKLLSTFLERGVAQTDNQLVIEHENAVNISDLTGNIQETVITCVMRNSDSLDILEEWEFLRDYKYSALFSTPSFKDTLEKLSTEYATSFNKKACPVYNRIESPVFWDYNEHIAFLKFNQKFDAVSPQTGKEVRTRYPVVVAFHKEEELVEIRFDTLRTIFIDTQDVFYVHLISTVVNCLKREFACDLAALNLDFLVAAAQNAVLGVRLVAQNMRMANGTYAELDVGKNEDYLLPFVGELSDFLLKYQNEFERVPELKEAFENFIKEKNITSDYPWITLLWENGGKTKSYKVKFTFNYYQKGFCLLQHYFSSALVGMERMNNVVNFINRIRPHTS